MPIKGISGVEIAGLRACHKLLLRRGMRLPVDLAALVERRREVSLGRRDVRRIEAALAVGGVVVSVAGGRVVVKARRGPGRPPGRAFGRKAARRSRGATDSRGRAMSAKRRASEARQGRYMGALAGLPAREKAKVKRVKREKGFPAAIALAKRLKKAA